jgi:hypothetical protein
VLGDFQDKPHIVALDLQSTENGRKLAVKVDVDDGTNDLKSSHKEG